VIGWLWACTGAATVAAGDVAPLVASRADPVAVMTACAPSDFPEVRLEPVGSVPAKLTWAGVLQGAIWVAEQEGRLVRLSDGHAVDVPDVRKRSPEEGLLGVAEASDGRLYLYQSMGEGSTDRRTTLFRVPASEAGAWDLDGREVLLEVGQPYGNHNGGALFFGPDGHLFVGIGDGGAGGDPQDNAQNPTTLLGTLLRLDVTPEVGFAVPSDNPFAGGGPGRAEVFAWGLRNPWRGAADPVTGLVGVGDVGQNAYEEITLVPLGANLGWRLREGNAAFTEGAGVAGLDGPLATYGRSQGTSITGGPWYRGERLPGLRGALIYGDFTSGRIWGVCTDGVIPSGPRELLDTEATIASFGLDANGEILVVGYHGQVWRLVPR